MMSEITLWENLLSCFKIYNDLKYSAWLALVFSMPLLNFYIYYFLVTLNSEPLSAFRDSMELFVFSSIISYFLTNKYQIFLSQFSCGISCNFMCDILLYIFIYFSCAVRLRHLSATLKKNFLFCIDIFRKLQLTRYSYTIKNTNIL